MTYTSELFTAILKLKLCLQNACLSDFVFRVQTTTPGLIPNICNAEIPEIPNLSTRDPTYVMTMETTHWTFCDVYSINASQWYRSKAKMSNTSCPSMYTCGTKFPIWMKDIGQSSTLDPQETKEHSTGLSNIHGSTTDNGETDTSRNGDTTPIRRTYSTSSPKTEHPFRNGILHN
ncbi:uncharacterized protein LOC132731023 [Ruditapes philippinarum]|uniref:uncharacterized protein LOC132731023 n=1 Tax=Ruditapes philippinarum TaxID=129788 RepID=UPI00295B66EA|nr:uncharacterized protein LOC132731023 [Ruditapes philippinarum]